MKYWMRMSVVGFVLLVIVAGAVKKVFFEGTQESFAVQEKEGQEEEIASQGQLLSGGQQEEKKQLPAKQEKQEFIQKNIDLSGSDGETLEKKYALAQYLWKKYKDEKSLSLAIGFAVQLGKYDEVDFLIKELGVMNNDALTDILPGEVVIKLVMNNSGELTFARLNQVKAIIESLYAEGKITETMMNRYFFIITLSKGDSGNSMYYLEKLKGTVLGTHYDQLITLKKATEQYGNTPRYYLRSVWGMYLYKKGWRGPALHIGQQVRQDDPNYLLAEQLIARSSIALKDRKQAIFALQHLQKTDTQYADMYTFFQGIAHFHTQDRENSILLLNQVDKKSAYAPDVKRYLLLNYQALGDEKRVNEIIALFSTQETLLSVDVVTVFDLFLYAEGTFEKKIKKEDSVLVQRFIDRCQKELKNDLHVCLYGKAGLLLHEGETKKAYAVLSRLVKSYPRKKLFSILATLAEQLGNNEERDNRHEQGLVMSQDENTPLIP